MTRATYTTGKGRAVYTRKDIDFIAAHVVPLDLWYIVPVEVCTPAPMLRFYPHRKAKRMRLEPYREAWNQVLSKQSNDVDVGDIHAQADETTHTIIPVILSEGAAPRSGSAPQSKDLASSSGKHPPKKPSSLHTYRVLCAQTSTVAIDASLAPWRIPRLKILVTREGKRILSGAQRDN